MDELTEGRYTIADDLTSLIIRAAKSTSAAEVGRYYKNDSFTIYQVFPEAGGIVWGRVSENTSGPLRFVGMRVNNHLKISRLATDTSADMILVALQRDMQRLKEWARTQGYPG